MACVNVQMSISTLVGVAVASAEPLQLTGDFLYWAVVFVILAIIAAALGAGEIAGITMTIAKWFVILFLVLALVSILL